MNTKSYHLKQKNKTNRSLIYKSSIYSKVKIKDPITQNLIKMTRLFTLVVSLNMLKNSKLKIKVYCSVEAVSAVDC